MTSDPCAFTWDKNITLNQVMGAHWQGYAEELFLTCFEIYLEDTKKIFLHDSEYANTIGACAKPDTLNFNPLFRAIELLSAVWRHQTKWGNENRIYSEQHTQTILKDWLEWLKSEPRNLEKEKPEIISHLVKAVAFRSTDHGETVIRNLCHLIEKHYIAPIQEEIRTEDDYKNFLTEQIANKRIAAAAKKSQYASISLTGKIKIYLLEVWEMEKNAWASHRREQAHEKRRHYNKGHEALKSWKIGGVLLLFSCSVVAVSIFLLKLFTFFGWNNFINKDGDSAETITSLAIIGTAFFSVLHIFIVLETRITKQGKPKKLCWIGLIGALLYTGISAFIDTVSGNYLYLESSQDISWVLLFVLYFVVALVVFLFSAVLAHRFSK